MLPPSACPSPRPSGRAADDFLPAIRGLRRVASWSLAVAVAFFCVAPAALRADIQAPNKPTAPGERKLQRRAAQPPSASAAQTKIQLGERVEIVLTGQGDPGKTLDFVLRTPPEHGTLEGAPRQLTRNTVAVTYVHRAEDGPGRDAFTYTVHARSGAMSAPETVDIEILDSAPSVAATPGELDFGAVQTGDFTRAEITLENRGGGIAAGRLDPPSPWVVEGSGTYRLGRGEHRTFRLEFRPQAGKSFVETLYFTNGEGHGVRLVGTGLAAPGQPDGAGSLTAANGRAAGTNNAGITPAAVSSALFPSGGGTLPAPSATPGRTLPAATPPAAVDRTVASTNTGGSASDPVAADAGFVSVNQAKVTQVYLRGVGKSTAELAWKPPVPLPRSYRVELRYLTYDEGATDHLRIDWRPYAQVDIRPRVDQVTATLRGLPTGERQTLRVVAVNEAGQLAAPSPNVMVATAPGSTWWHVTPLKVLFAMLALCLALALRKRWEDRQMMQEIDDRRRDAAAADDKQLSFHR